MRNFLQLFDNKFFKLSVKNISQFALLWFLIGFPLGTATLMGPVRWITNFTRSQNYTESTENLIVKVIIVLFIIISFVISLYLCRTVINYKSLKLKLAIWLLPLILTFASLILWMNPSLMQYNSKELTESSKNIEFIFGQYPDEEKIIQLKKDNIKAIISLLHEAVIPFEPKLLVEEKELAKKYEIELIHVPMLPWVSSNETSIKMIKEIATNKSGKYYVHCYLGKDRVGVVRRIVKQILGEQRISGTVNQRKIEEINQFERGEIFKLEEDVYLTPFPTDEEFFAFILNGSFNNVVSLLNPNKKDDVQWIDKEEKILKENGINYTLLPIDLNNYDSQTIYDYTKNVKELKKPILIHAFLTKSPESKLFYKSYTLNKPVLLE